MEVIDEPPAKVRRVQSVDECRINKENVNPKIRKIVAINTQKSKSIPIRTNFDLEYDNYDSDDSSRRDDEGQIPNIVPQNNSQNQEVTEIGLKRPSLLLNGKYFQVVERLENIIKAKCMTCNETYSASTRSTSNFITHLKVYNHC